MIPAVIGDLSRNGGTRPSGRKSLLRRDIQRRDVPPLRDKSPYRFLPPSPAHHLSRSSGGSETLLFGKQECLRYGVTVHGPVTFDL